MRGTAASKHALVHAATSGDVDDHGGRLDRRDRGYPDLETELVGASRLISDTTRCGPAWISTWAMTPSRRTPVTIPGKWLRADSLGSGSGDSAGTISRATRASSAVDHQPAGGVVGQLHAAGVGPAAKRVVADTQQSSRVEIR